MIQHSPLAAYLGLLITVTILAPGLLASAVIAAIVAVLAIAFAGSVALSIQNQPSPSVPDTIDDAPSPSSD